MSTEMRLNTGTKLYSMVMSCPNIQKSILSLSRRVIEMVHNERFDPKSLKFNIMSPKGEENRIHITLLAAEYSTAPIIEAPDSAVSTALVRIVDSLFKAIGCTSSMMGFMNVCPELCTIVYAATNYINEYYFQYSGGKDLKHEIIWDCYDHHSEKDLIITGVIK